MQVGGLSYKITYLRNCHDSDNFLGMFICKEVETIWQISFLSPDIQLIGLQEPEYVVGTRRVAEVV